MLIGLYIFVDDDFGDPLYADPASEDLDEDLWVVACEAVNDALEGEGPASGVQTHDEYHVGWKTRVKTGLSFVAIVTDDVRKQSVTAYIEAVLNQYLEEVDNPRDPERSGVADVVVDVIPPWEDD